MGINVNRTIAFTFFIGGALAGAAGMVYGLYLDSGRFLMGFEAGLFAFTAAVLGGIGNYPWRGAGRVHHRHGAGAATTASPRSRREADWTQSIVFSILILILVLRPEGLLGDREAVR